MSVFNINVSAVNIHREPAFTSEAVTQALLGESCTILSQEDPWYKIRQHDGYEGWIYSFFGEESERPYKTTHRCYSMFAPVFDAKGGKVIRDICFGNQLKMINENDELNILLPDGRKGWTDADLHSEPLDATRENIIETAKRFTGTPYQWGGKSPGGMDCSGLIQTVLSSVGIQIPRDASQQADYFDENKILLDQAKQGDLLFFAENDKINHVAISLGEKRFIHSQGWVKEQSLNPESDSFNAKLSTMLVSIHSIKGVVL